MKYSVSFLTLLLISTSSLASSSEDNKQLENKDYYFKGGVSYSISNDLAFPEPDLDFNTKQDNGFGVSLAAGMFIADNFAVEAEIQYKKFNFDEAYDSSNSASLDGNVSYTTGLLNGYYYPTSSSKVWNPFLGVGVGLSLVAFNDFRAEAAESDGMSDTDTVFSYQVMIGNRFEILDDFYIDAEYRYFATNDFTITDDDNNSAALSDSGNHSLLLSLVKTF